MWKDETRLDETGRDRMGVNIGKHGLGGEGGRQDGMGRDGTGWNVAQWTSLVLNLTRSGFMLIVRQGPVVFRLACKAAGHVSSSLSAAHFLTRTQSNEMALLGCTPIT